MIDKDALKYNSQYHKLIQVLAILTMFSKHLSSLTTSSSLRCFHKILSSSGVDKLLYLSIAIINSFLEKRFYDESTVWMEVPLIKTCSLVNFELNWMFDKALSKGLQC